MARSTWSGSISFGLVNVPIKLYGATTSKGISFNQIDRKTGKRVRQLRVVEGTTTEVPYDQIVKGFQVADDRYVIVDAKELEALTPKSKRIDIEKFVPGDEIDSMAYADSYFIQPDGNGSGKAYKLLVQAMEASGKVGIGRLVLRTKEQLVAVRAKDGVLVCSTLRWSGELNASPVKVPDDGDPTEAELAMAGQLIEAVSGSWAHDEYKDVYSEQVMALIQAKASGEDLPALEGAPADEAPDLMGALEASLKATEKAKPAAKKAKPRRKKMAA